MKFGDTIAAVSTPHGRGGVALLRVSGPRAVEICEAVFRPFYGGALSEQPARRAIYGEICKKTEQGESLSVDDGLATVFRAPASFTGEDTVEITCHGGILLTQTVLTALIAAGARQADAGEFTRRAFVNGKMGLSAAEALGELLEAQTEEQLTLAHIGTRGKVEGACGEIYEALRHVLASIYVRIDYPDEDLADMSDEEIEVALGDALHALEALAATYRTGHAIMEGILTVICGAPNVGKSSLYNRIVGREAAIVTEIEGTTRDILSETAQLGRVTLRLFDTAGLHETGDPVERIGIDRARRAMEEAELILAVFDGTRAPTKEETARLERLRQGSATVIAVYNKIDCPDTHTKGSDSSAYAVSLSAKTGEGMEALTALVDSLFTSGTLDLRRDPILTNARQHGAALGAMDALRDAIEAMHKGYAPDQFCNDVERAMETLTQLDGRAVSEDIVSEIFSHFCVGK